jgi:Nif-specific regulatory protein
MIVLNGIGKLSKERQTQLCENLANLARLAREGHSFARFVCLSTKNLEELVDQGLLLPELLVRIAVVQILIDPLRERREDIPELARHFLRRYAVQFGKTIKDFSADAIAALSSHNWPGNVRELRNVVERAVLLASGTMLTELELQRGIAESSSMAVSTAGLSLEEMEKVHIDATLRSTGWKKSRTALMLGIERSTLDRKIKRYELHRPPKPGRPVRGEAAPASGQ